MIGGYFFHMLACVSGLGEPQSQTTELERAALRKHSKGKRRGVEIGVFEGVTTCIIAEGMAQDGVLYSIDPFPRGRLGVCWSKPIVKSMIRRSRLAGRVRVIEKHSHEAIGVLSGVFDFIFVDGDHSLHGITTDWHDWSERVVSGGVIALHDTRVTSSNQTIAGLGSVEYFETRISRDPRFELIDQVDSLSVLRRKSDRLD